MNSFWVKISIVLAIVFVSLTVITVIFFRSAGEQSIAETKTIAEVKDTRQVQKESRPASKSPKAGTWQPQAKEPARLTEPRWLNTAEVKELNIWPKELQQRPFITDGAHTLPVSNLKERPVIDRSMLRQYLNNAQTKKLAEPSRESPEWIEKPYNVNDRRMLFQSPGKPPSNRVIIELLRELRARHNRQHVATGKEMHLRYLDSLKTKGTVEQAKPGLPDAELRLSEEQKRKIRERALLHIIEQYRNNLEDKKIRELLLERLKPHQKQRKAAAKEKKETPSK